MDAIPDSTNFEKSIDYDYNDFSSPFDYGVDSFDGPGPFNADGDQDANNNNDILDDKNTVNTQNNQSRVNCLTLMKHPSFGSHSPNLPIDQSHRLNSQFNCTKT